MKKEKFELVSIPYGKGKVHYESQQNYQQHVSIPYGKGKVLSKRRKKL